MSNYDLNLFQMEGLLQAGVLVLQLIVLGQAVLEPRSDEVVLHCRRRLWPLAAHPQPSAGAALLLQVGVAQPQP